MIRWIAIALLCTVLVSGFPAHLQDAACDLPTDGWDTVAPEEAGLDGEVLEAGEATVEDDLPYVRSVLVIRHGCLAYEHYYGDVTAEDAANVFSVTKSVTATLIGIAIAEGAISSVHDSIADYLDLDAAIHARRLPCVICCGCCPVWAGKRGTHLISSGCCSAHATRWTSSSTCRWIMCPARRGATAPRTPICCPPCSPRRPGESAADFAAETLFGPLGIVPYDWKTDPEGINLGGTETWLTPARYGEVRPAHPQ
ncbi:MAG: serine hydrolase [Chloroflexi bacterium]|nr:serine hydrolase [Chloroflexota bacterium]